MAELKDYSTSAGSNNSASPNGWPENMSPSGVNNSDRELAARIARWLSDNNGSLATAGTSTAITVTLNQQFSAWFDGLTFAARITTTCGATPTINPTGSGALGAKSLYWSGSGTQLAANDLTSTAVAWFMYEATSDKVYVFAAPPTTYAPQTLLTTRGDIIIRDASAPVRLAVGAASTVLRTDGTDPSWGKVAGAHIAMGSDAQGDVLYHNGTAYARLGAGTSGYALKTGGAGANPSWGLVPILGSAAATTSGTAATFSSLPTGIKRITLMLNEVSLDGTDNLIVQLSTAATFATSGYVSTSAAVASGGATIVTSTAGFAIAANNAADISSGHMILTHVGSNLWVASHSGKKSTSQLLVGGGTVTLGGELDGIRVTRSGTNSFDAGSVNIIYE